MERTLAEFLTHAPVFLRLMHGEIVYWSAGCEELYGYSPDEAVGRISHELLRTVFPGRLEDIEAILAAQGEWRGRVRHRTKDGREIWTESLWRVRAAERPAARLVVEQNTDITDRVRVEQQRELLTQELNHRVKNTLAVVQGIARLTFGHVERDLVRTFEDRLSALSEAHNVLMRESWSHAPLREILDDVLRSLHLRDRVSVDGEAVVVSPNAAVAYALAFHELATNALKHGALSRPEGRVEVAWRLYGEAGRNILLTWTERGGPRASAPAREGFGLKLIKRAVAAELNSPVTLTFGPEGLVCTIDGRVEMTPPGAVHDDDPSRLAARWST